MFHNPSFHAYLVKKNYQHQRVKGGRFEVKNHGVIEVPAFDLYRGDRYLVFIEPDGHIEFQGRDAGFEQFLACFMDN